MAGREVVLRAGEEGRLTSLNRRRMEIGLNMSQPPVDPVGEFEGSQREGSHQLPSASVPRSVFIAFSPFSRLHLPTSSLLLPGIIFKKKKKKNMAST